VGRPRVVHRCSDCGASALRWSGRCGNCGGWNTLVEEAVPLHPVTTARAPDARLLADIESGAAEPRPTRVGELDRVLSGGLVPGSVTLIGGEPGTGKSTLLLQALGSLAGSGARCLLVSGEESPEQVKRRAQRLEVDGVWVVAETSLPGIVAAVDRLGPDVLVVDSIQTTVDPDLDAGPGAVGQVRGCAQALVELAKLRRLTVVLVGHVTKEGALAGPRVLEHVVDTVLTLEGERHHALRLLRATKHRFGSTGELGLFEMTDRGLVDVPDPSRLFLGDRREGASGSAVVATMEGHRPLLVEVQALVTGVGLVMPRRSASGLDAGRLSLLTAVLERRAGVSLAGREVYASAVGGVRVVEPGADLGLCLAVVSSVTDVPLPDDLVACGEVGLAGEIRQVTQTPRRLAEAARLGFRRALVPLSAAGPPVPHLEVARLASLAQALEWAGLPPPGRRMAATTI
jgi:DNA repair protein RadA/Sms